MLRAANGRILPRMFALVAYDDQSKPDQAIFTAHKLIGEDGVKLVVNGSYSASGRAAAPVFQKSGVVMILAYGVHPASRGPGIIFFASSISGRQRARRPRCMSARRSA